MGVYSEIKRWMGPLWWYAAIMFCVQRLGDAINAFIGLWVVPKYVLQEELGAVLPLVQVGCVLGLPLSILLQPFTKFLNTYAAKGELGKVKRLLRDAFILAFLLFVGMMVFAQFFMPLVFERMRVGPGRLGILIVASGVVGTLTPVFINALQGLKRFRILGVFGILSAPIRLVTMLVFLPIRALSGYFMGQIVPALVMIGGALFGLRRCLSRQVKSEPYLRSEWRDILSYTLPGALLLVAGTVQLAVESFVIRHRLPDIESAGYYVISRFAEAGAHAGMTFSFILFPLVSERHEQGAHSYRYLWHSVGACLAAGLFLVGGFCVYGEWLLGLISTWRTYVPYAPHMAFLAGIFALRSVSICFASYEMACRRFRFVWYTAMLAFLEVTVMYGLTGYPFFIGILPDAWVDWMASVNAARLEFLLALMLAQSVLAVVCMGVHLACRFRRTSGA